MSTFETIAANENEDLDGLLLQRLEGLRKQLLDLSNRNRLLSFKHSERARTHIRIIDELPDILFQRLKDGKRLRFKSLPEPETEAKDEQSDEFLLALEAARATDEEYRIELGALSDEEQSSSRASEVERALCDQVRETLGLEPWVDQSGMSRADFAREQGLEPSYALPFPKDGDDDPERYLDSEVQTLLLPREMDRKLSGVLDQARTMLQEAGVNTLYAAFGFLEWQEPDASDTKHLAPLLLMPVQIERRTSKPWRHYDLFSDNADAEINETLAIRLRQDFGYEMPEFGEDETPEIYLRRVTKHASAQPGWKVRRFVTVGHFGFSKLAMYNDLAAAKWPDGNRLERHTLIRNLLLGGPSGSERTFVAEDYEIDSTEIDEEDVALIADADASQHSALIDVVKGKDLVIKGPPGTGKSQTITNIIAALMSAGRSVLFVAEKKAALDVVFARLEQVGLDDFCLQAHSNKTSKSAVLEGLKRRIDLQDTLAPPRDFAAQLAELRDCRDQLNAYADALNAPIGAQRLSVHEVLWGAQRARAEAGDACAVLDDIALEDVLDLTTLQRNKQKDVIKEVFVRLENILQAHEAVSSQPWSWIGACHSDPFAQENIKRKAADWRDALIAVRDVRETLAERLGTEFDLTTSALEEFAQGLQDVPDPPEGPVAHLVEAVGQSAHRKQLRELCEIAGGASDAESEDADGRDTRVFVPAELLPVDRGWTHLAETMLDAMKRIEDEAPDAENLAAANEFARELRDVAALVKASLSVAQAAQGVVVGGPMGRPGDFTAALMAVRCACLVDSGCLLLRHETLFRDGARVTLGDGYEIACQLGEIRTDLEAVFALKPLPELAIVSHHARALRAAGAFTAFNSEVRQAKAFFKSICHTTRRPSSRDMARLLTRLEAYLDDREEFEADRELHRLLGSRFRGEETDFGRYLDLVDWYDQVLEAFPSSDERSSAYRRFLLEAPIEHLSELIRLSQGLDLDTAIDEVGGLEREVDSIEAEVGAALQRVGRIETACRDLGDCGVSTTASFEVLGRVAHLLSDLEEVRFAAVTTEAENPSYRLSIRNLAGAVDFLDILDAADLPAEIKIRVTSACSEQEIDGLRAAGAHLAGLCTSAAASQNILNEAVDITGSLLSEDGEETTLDRRIRRIDAALAQPDALSEWTDYNTAVEKAAAEGLETFVDRLIQRRVTSDVALACHDWLITRSIAKSAFERSPELSKYNGLSMTQARDKFQGLDRETLERRRRQIAADLCRRPIAHGNGVGLKSEFTELALIRHELGKKRRHVPLRDLFARSGDALQQMKPCFMMSPLSVATYIEPGELEFDVVVIDEASQMPLEDALGVMARGRQSVIVGDNMQLPPTSFFRRFEDAFDDEGDVEGEDLDVESVLDQGANVLRPPRELRWHYRSQHQDLIGFSNKHFYEDRLTVFPSFREDDPFFGIQLAQVNGQYADRRNLAEVESVVAWAVEFMKLTPERSLGIVAINQLQRDLIRDEMDRVFQRDAEAEAYKRRWQATLHPFFVKNLENVQGDERDVIAVSTVYGPNASGKVAQNFGPISRKHGHRRLNVLFTRARQQLVLFTSLAPDDIRIADATGPGPRALKHYLEFARSGHLDPAEAEDRVPETDLEKAVAARLAQSGYEVVPKVGIAGYFVDLGIRHPDFPGLFMVGVECDGATYHSAKSARDRDRLREEVLKDQGWVLQRIWSTDWFRDPQAETRKLIEFIDGQARIRRMNLASAAEMVGPGKVAPSVRTVPVPAIAEPVAEPEVEEAPAADEFEDEAAPAEESGAPADEEVEAADADADLEVEVEAEPEEASEPPDDAEDFEPDEEIDPVELDDGIEDVEPDAAGLTLVADDADAPELDEDEDLAAMADEEEELELYGEEDPEVLTEEEPEPEMPAARPEGPICELGDTVSYHFADVPEDVITVTILLGRTDPDKGTISRLSPIGDALAGSGIGHDIEVFLTDGARTIVVDKIVKRDDDRPVRGSTLGRFLD